MPEIVSLHRYFLNADRMRWHFDQLLRERPAPAEIAEGTEHYIYMLLWYGCLRVVIEGWVDLGLTDARVDGLLDAEMITRLNGARNDIFHFQRGYVAPRTQRLFNEPGFPAWVRSVHAVIGESLLERIQAN